MADAGLLWKADPEFEEEVKTMNVFLRNSLVTLLFVWVLMSLAALSGCGTGDYNSKLDTAIQNAKSGAPPKSADEDGELADGDLQSLYPIDDEEEEAEEEMDADDLDADDPDPGADESADDGSNEEEDDPF